MFRHLTFNSEKVRTQDTDPPKLTLDYPNTYKTKFQLEIDQYEQNTWPTLKEWKVWRLSNSDLLLHLKSLLWTLTDLTLKSTNRTLTFSTVIEDRCENLPLTVHYLYLPIHNFHSRATHIDFGRVKMMSWGKSTIIIFNYKKLKLKRQLRIKISTGDQITNPVTASTERLYTLCFHRH